MGHKTSALSGPNGEMKMDKEINEVVETVTNEVRAFNEETITPIKDRLASLEERGTSASDEKVTDLEKQLNEAEARSHEKLESLQEEIRLAQAAPFVAEQQKSAPFEGAFFRNLDEARQGILQGDTRAITTSSISGAGAMNAAQASQFIDYVVGDKPTLSGIERRMMSGPTADLDKIAVAGRQLRTVNEGTAATASDSLTFSKVTLTTKEVVWAEDLSLSFLEDNIAGGNAEGQSAARVGRKRGEDLNDLAWNGDEGNTAGGDTQAFLTINDGFEDMWGNDATVVDVDMSSNNATALLALNSLYKGMPSEYRSLSGQTIFCSPGFATEYMEEIANRATAVGDATLTGGLSGLSYFGVPIVVDRHLNADNIYMTPRDNMVFGVQRDVTSETEWNPRKRQVELTVSLRFDFQTKLGAIVSRGHGLVAGLE